MFFYEIFPKLLLFRTKINVDGVNFAEVFPVMVRVPLTLSMSILEMYLILISCFFFPYIVNYSSL